MNWKKIENWHEIKQGDLITCDEWGDDKAERFICMHPFNENEICLELGSYDKSDVWYVSIPEKPKKKWYAYISEEGFIKYFSEDKKSLFFSADLGTKVYSKTFRRVHLEYNDVIEVDE